MVLPKIFKVYCKGTFIIKMKDRILLSFYYFIYKLGPEYSIQYTDYTASIIGKSCSTLAIILLIKLHKLPLIGSLLVLLINENEANSSAKLKYSSSDVIKGLLSAIAVVMFSIDSKSGPNLNLRFALIGFIFIFLGLFADSIRGLKIMILNAEARITEDEAKSEQLKNEYLLTFNLGVVIIGSIGLAYQWFYSNLSDFIFANLNDRYFLLGHAYTIVCCSLCQYFNVSVLKDEGPIITSILVSFKNAFSILFSIFIFKKHVSLYKGFGLLIVLSIFVYEIKNSWESKNLIKMQSSNDCVIGKKDTKTKKSN